MDPERWQQIDQILQAALDLPTAEQQPFLDRACAGDEPLRAEVEALIDSYQQAGNFLDKPAVALAVSSSDNLPAYPDPYLGIMLNERYLIERELGRGGIGVVYL